MPATRESSAALRNAAQTKIPPGDLHAEFSSFIRGMAVLTLAAHGDCGWVAHAQEVYQDLLSDKSSHAKTLAIELALALAYSGNLDGWPTIREQLIHPQSGTFQFQQHGALIISLIRRQLLPPEEIDDLYAALPYRQRLPARAYLYP